jgi:L-ascorbate metabolism protein UlaG (beta-lactamase superfamily)
MPKLARDTRLRWLGHAAFEIVSPRGQVLLVDPWLENPRAPAGYAASLTRVDVLLPTHAHFDHLGNTVELGRRFQPEVPCVFELSVYLERQGLERTRPMNKGGTQTVAGGVQVTMVAADHSAGILDDGHPVGAVYGGEAAGFVLAMENGFRLYHAGDTNLFGDMRWIGELYRPEVALLPIGGLYTMGPREAAAAAKLLGARFVVPMHYGTFPALAGTPADLEKELAGTSIQVLALSPGEVLE